MSEENNYIKRSEKNSKNNKKIKKKGENTFFKILTVFLFIILLLVGAGAGYFYVSFNKINNVPIDKADLGITSKEELDKYDNYSQIKNIALLGIDNEDGVGRSDSIMIATIDPVHNKLKISSIMRDSYVNIEGRGYDKINHAYAFGGPALTIKTINQNFGLNIEDFVAVDFSTLPIIIDSLGGLEIDITQEELPYVNDYIYDLNVREGTKSPRLTHSGPQLLDGVQALAYSRVRYTSGGDSERTQRQRTILNGLFEKALTISPTQYPGFINDILPHVKTNLSASDVLGLASKVATMGGGKLEQERFPRDGSAHSEMINGVYYLVLDEATNKQQIMDYIFDDK